MKSLNALVQIKEDAERKHFLKKVCQWRHAFLLIRYTGFFVSIT